MLFRESAFRSERNVQARTQPQMELLGYRLHVPTLVHPCRLSREWLLLTLRLCNGLPCFSSSNQELRRDHSEKALWAPAFGRALLFQATLKILKQKSLRDSSIKMCP